MQRYEQVAVTPFPQHYLIEDSILLCGAYSSLVLGSNSVCLFVKCIHSDKMKDLLSIPCERMVPLVSGFLLPMMDGESTSPSTKKFDL